MQNYTNYDQVNTWCRLAAQMKMAATNLTTQQQMVSPLEQHWQYHLAINSQAPITLTSLNNNDISTREQQYHHKFHNVTNHNIPSTSSATPINTILGLPPTPPSSEPATQTHYHYNNDEMQQVKYNVNHNHNNNNGTDNKTSSSEHCSKSDPSNMPIMPCHATPLDTQTVKSPQQSPDKMNNEQETFTIDGEEYNLAQLESGDKKTKYLESMFDKNYNSHGKLQMQACKFCKKKFETKVEAFKCIETHIEPGKQVHCLLHPRCPFVSELKHYLKYHLMKHLGIKPIKCPISGCTYACKNKAMLTSHMKSHSDVILYRCNDCGQTDKFLSTFKKHMRKQNHTKHVVYDEDGNMTDKQIDIYGKRRGPKSKYSVVEGNIKRNRTLSAFSQNSTLVETPQLAAALQGTTMAQQQQQEQVQVCTSPGRNTNSNSDQISTPMDPRMMLAYLHGIQSVAAFAQLSPIERERFLLQQHIRQYHQQQFYLPIKPETNDEANNERDYESTHSAVDFSLPTTDEDRHTPEIDAAMNLKTSADNNPVKAPLAGLIDTPARGKRRVLQLNNSLHMNMTAQSMDDEESNTLTARPTFTPVESPEIFAGNCYNTTASLNSNDSGTGTSNELEDESATSSTNNKQFDALHECKHCGMLFTDSVLCTLHKGYHSHDDPFKCNLCGEKCHNHVDFHVHLARTAHA